MFDTILFDLDGTLTDSEEGILNSVEYALNKNGLQCERSELLSFIGPPLEQSFARKFPSLDPVKAVEDYREYYRDRGIIENRVYDGIEETLSALKNEGYHLAVATSKPEHFAKQIIEHFHLAPYFEGIYGATMDSSRVKKEDIIDYALDQYKDHRILMVGDRRFDIEGAHTHGLHAVGVLYGFGSREELEKAGADYLIEKPQELIELVNLHKE